MKHIKLYEEFINEKYLSSNTVKGPVYHASSVEIKRISSDPMWFALEKSHSDKGWFSNIIDDGRDEAYQYEGKVSGKVGNLSDPDVEKVFDEIGEDPYDYADELVGNPTAKEVMNLKATKALIKAGYVGLIYFDYDPRDFQADLEAIIVFNPLKSVKGWKLVKKYP